MSEPGGKRSSRSEIYLTPETELAIRRLAELKDRTYSKYVSMILVAHIRSMNEGNARQQANPSPLSVARAPLFTDEDEERLA